MRVIEASSADQALERGLRLLRDTGEWRETRCGPALVSPDPVTTLYVHPTHRVLLHQWRDANPFFHLFEALWMLAGRNDVASLLPFNARIKEFADDGKSFHGSYGRRWRRHFYEDEGSWMSGHYLDQITSVVTALRARPNDRRQIIQMWDPEADLLYAGKDAPCNTCVHVQRDSTGRLDVTVFCRSNDVVWGAYGSDLVTFSVLQEYLAAAVGCPVGRYWQVSDNWHGYTATAEPLFAHLGGGDPPDRYLQREVDPFPLVVDVARFDAELERLLGEDRNAAEDTSSYGEPFLRRVAVPMLQAWRCHKDETITSKTLRCESALTALGGAAPCDWRTAASEWLCRRLERCRSR